MSQNDLFHYRMIFPSWPRAVGALVSWREMLPFLNTRITIPAVNQARLSILNKPEKHRPNTALAWRAEMQAWGWSCLSEVFLLLHACCEAFVISHTGDPNFHKQWGSTIGAWKVASLVSRAARLWRKTESSSREFLSSLSSTQSPTVMWNELNVLGISSYLLEAMKMIH